MGSEIRTGLTTGDYPRPERVIVSYVGRDQLWAEWIAAELERANCVVETAEWDDAAAYSDLLGALGQAGGNYTKFVAVVSGKYLGSVLPDGPDGAAGVTSHKDLFIPVVVDRGRVPWQFWQLSLVTLTGVTNAGEAQQKLLRTVLSPQRAAQVPPGDLRATGRYPGQPPAVWSSQIPPRNPFFTGRSGLLSELRRQLTGDWTAVLPQGTGARGLQGMGGVGKTQLAIEYAYRFAAAYDVVWWVPAEEVAVARQSLAELARQLNVALPGAETEELVRAAREALRTGSPYRNWLLIFDNAESPEAIQQLLVEEMGDTLITSRVPRWSELADVLQVQEYARAESISFLLRRAPGLSPAELDELADELGDLPLGLEHAAAWLASTKGSAASYLDLYHERPTELLSTMQLARYPRPVAVTWEIAMNRLRENSPAALELLNICAFLGPARIPLDLFIQAPEGLLPPSLEAAVHQATARAELLRALESSSLSVTEREARQAPGLRQHRMVQALIKDAASPEQRERHRTVAHRLLAATDPGDPYNPANVERYRELLPLALFSEAVTDTDPEVQGLVSNLIQALINTGEQGAALQLVEQALAAWTPTVDSVDRVMVGLSMRHAGIMRSLGRFDEAIAISQACYDQCMERLGLESRLTMGIASSLAAGYRRVGNLAAASQLDQQIWEVRTRIYPPDDEQVLLAAHNVALNLRLAGRFSEALEIDQQNHRAFARTQGPDHQDTLFALNNVARDLRERGDYYESLSVEEDVYQRYLQLFGMDSPDTLRAMKNLAISRRKAGRYRDAWQLGEEVLDRHRQKFGDLHVETLSAATNFANDHRCVEEYVRGLGYAEQAVRGFRDVLGENHGFTGAAMTNHAALIRLAGHPADALALNREARDILRAAYGVDHRYTLSCAVNLASDLAELGEFEAARQQDEDTLTRLRRTSGESHPYTLSCALNLALDLRALHERSRYRELLADTRERYERTLGEDHPETIAARAHRRADCDIEPPPT